MIRKKLIKDMINNLITSSSRKSHIQLLKDIDNIKDSKRDIIHTKLRKKLIQKISDPDQLKKYTKFFSMLDKEKIIEILNVTE